LFPPKNERHGGVVVGGNVVGDGFYFEMEKSFLKWKDFSKQIQKGWFLLFDLYLFLCP
jgi:hypothetical protein